MMTVPSYAVRVMSVCLYCTACTRFVVFNFGAFTGLKQYKALQHQAQILNAIPLFENNRLCTFYVTWKPYMLVIPADDVP